MAKKHWKGENNSSVKVFYNSEDADGAFWDEFYGERDKFDFEGNGNDGYVVRIVDEETGEEWEFEGVFNDREVLKLD